MTNSNEAFSRVVIDAQLADQDWNVEQGDAPSARHLLPYIPCYRYHGVPR